MKPMTPDLVGASRNRRLSRARGRAGFGLAELMVVVAVIGSLFAMTLPFFLRYYQAAAVKSASEQVIALFNQGRNLAIQTNSTQGVCVRLPSNTQMQFILNGCNGTVWVGVWTDANGNINLPQGFTLSPPTDVVFDYLGTALPAVTYTMTNPSGGTTLTISIAVSGRIRSP
ncbi:MAG: pilus assembly FimT family protein [Candidatus Methylomirabilis sp.]